MSLIRRIAKGVWDRFKNEPVLANALLRAVVVVATAFWLQWSPEQIGAVYLLIEAITSFISRQRVTPVE